MCVEQDGLCHWGDLSCLHVAVCPDPGVPEVTSAVFWDATADQPHRGQAGVWNTTREDAAQLGSVALAEPHTVFCLKPECRCYQWHFIPPPEWFWTRS